jgi:peptidoglycan/xylan/chitin deacetylase (PgdA/CDA1 family)
LLPLAELIAAARDGRIPERAVALTFDDGYADNLERGLPLLERYGAPATFYIPTGYIDRAGGFWWDELEDLVTGPGERPDRLDLTLHGRGVAVSTATEADRRRALVDVLHPILRVGPPATTERWLELIREWADGAIAQSGDAARRPMTEEELARLAQSELVELGAHTSTHPRLPALGRREQLAEIEASRRFLAERLDRPPSSFSFPFGENSPTSRRLVRSCGFDNAVGVQGMVPLTAAARRYELPRTMAVEESAEALAARMERTLAFRERGRIA